MLLLGIIRSHFTVFLVLFLANFIVRSHAQAALDFMEMDPSQELSARCKGDRDCAIQSEEFETNTGDPNGEEPQFSTERPLSGLCGSPPEFPYAELEDEYLDPRDFTKGYTVKYNCKTGYVEVAGTKASVTCMEDGNWSSPDTFCKSNFCGPPPRLGYGVPREEYLERTIFPKGTRVTYVCRLGYVRVSQPNSYITCLANGIWSTPREFCKRKSCGNPGDVENGNMQATDFDFGSRVTYVCNPGYMMISKRNYRDCQEDGTWSNALPECTVLSCPSPPDIENGHYYPLKEDYNYLDSVKYVCKGSLTLIGEQNIACTEEGKWSSKAPECRAVLCPNPNVENGVKLTGFSGPYNMNSVVRFTCKSSQYKMIGFNIVKCNQNSEWEPELPKCIGICQYIPRFPYAELVEPTTESTFLEGNTLQFKCKEGFEPVPGRENTAKCSRLRWHYSDQFCKPITCVEPEPVPHGRIISGSFTYGNEITYTCDIGYKITYMNRRCLSDRSWSFPIPECEVQTCAAPGVVKDGRYSPQKEKYVYNDTISFNCDEGFQLSGQASITCRPDGRWNYRAPECRGICNSPPIFHHAQSRIVYNTDTTFLVGAEVRYTCRNGYYRDNSFPDFTVCLGNFTWKEMSDKFCKIYKCPTPAFLKNGWFDPESEEYLYNDTVTYDCHEGFQLVGQASMTCSNGGRWNYNTPECKGVCDNPPNLHYAQLDIGSKFIKTYFAGSTVHYTCRPGYFPNIYSNGITCLENFTWSQINNEFCDRISCGNPPKVGNSTFEAKDFLFESEVIYKCEKGFKMVSQSNSVKCGSNGKWTGTLPVCEAQKCSPPENLEDGSYSIMKDEYFYGDTVIYKCDSLRLVGNPSITCSDEGKWSSDAPLCKAVCTFPPESDFAVLEDEFTHQKFFESGKTVQYKCRPGFDTVTGKSNNLTCLDSLNWSQHELFCTHKSCGNPGDINHGQMQYENFLFGSRVNYTCDPGYTMIAKTTYRECQADGTWSGKSPLCKESVCDHIWELQEEARKCTSTPDEWIKYLQIQYLYLQIENLKLDIEIKKQQRELHN